MVRRERLSDKAEIADSVRSGIGKSLRGGSVLVGDIAGAVGGRPSPLASTALADDGRINAVTYSEFFAQGRAFRRTVRAVMEVYKALSVNLPLSSAAAVVPGISPHAPFSVNRHAYDLLTVLLIKQGCSPPISSHIAESAEEVRLIAYGDGPLAELLKSVGVWDEWTQAVIGRGETPLEHVAGGRYLPLMNACAIHCNAVTDEDMVAMLEGSISCIYCPRASAYFGAERSFGPHRYAEMLDPGWGINVALGTDSIVNLDTPSRISVWDEMAFLHRRDGTDPIKLLKMATLNGAAALRRDPAQFRFVEGGHLAGLATVLLEDTNRGGSGAELLSGALRGGHVADQGPELLAIGRV